MNEKELLKELKDASYDPNSEYRDFTTLSAEAHRVIKQIVQAHFAQQGQGDELTDLIMESAHIIHENVIHSTWCMVDVEKELKKLLSLARPKVTREWIAEQVMEHLKPGKHTPKEDYKHSFFQWCAIIDEIFIKAGVEVEKE